MIKAGTQTAAIPKAFIESLSFASWGKTGIKNKVREKPNQNIQKSLIIHLAEPSQFSAWTTEFL